MGWSLTFYLEQCSNGNWRAPTALMGGYRRLYDPNYIPHEDEYIYPTPLASEPV